MTRTLKLLSAAIVMALLGAGVAFAATSPTVSTGRATKIQDTAASVSGTVNPNGNGTEYYFSYGPTTAYGTNSPAHPVGTGSKAVSVAQAIGSLTPGTVYHYRIVAINRSGTSTGADRTFTTTGHPPASVVTGPPSGVTNSAATVTGTINPEGAPTTWEFQYGPTTSYGMQTAPQVLPPGTAPVPVSAQIAGLAPSTLFHYRLVALNGPTGPSTGADASFFTEPLTRPRPRIAARTTPKHDRRSPYTFTTHGALRGGSFIPAPQRCTGTVTVRIFHGPRRLAFVAAPVAGDCTFSVPATFRRLHARGPVRLKVKMTFQGNGYLAPSSRTNTVLAG